MVNTPPRFRLFPYTTLFRSIEKFERPVRERVSADEWQLRCELAAAHRLIAHFVFVDMTYNHISVRLPGEPEHFLVKADRSEEHTSELQSRQYLVCRLLLEKK